MIGLMEVKCPNHNDDNGSKKRARGNYGEALAAASDGCGWVGKCEELQNHDNICNFKLVTCEIEGCDTNAVGKT
jgi:hypothetical protein